MTGVWPTGVVRSLSYIASSAARTDWPSVKPQLIDTTDTPGCCAALWTALIRSASDWLLASTRMIWAPGAIACVHSTSSASSLSQLATPAPVGSTAGSGVDCPDWLSTVKNAEAGPY